MISMAAWRGVEQDEMRRNAMLWLAATAVAGLFCPSLAVAQDGNHEDPPPGPTSP